jgi:ring-1,2-phenylacetyl-CoA epoxidase subunit PaaE
VLQYHSLRILDKRPETGRAVALTFELPADQRENFRFLAGQHLGLKATVNGEELRRTYSIQSSPGEPTLSICVRLVPAGRFSGFVAERVRIGDRLDVLMPNGSFHTASAPGRPRTIVAFAAGIGITPVVSIVRHVLESEVASRIILFYGNRDAESVLFTEELQALKDRFVARFALHFLLTAESQEIDLYNGRLTSTKLDSLSPGLFHAQAVDEFFICGPGGMIADLTAALVSKQVEPHRIHGEHFLVSAPQTQAAAAAPPKVRAETPQARVSVVIDGRTRSFEMPMDGTSVLDAASESGLDLPFSCRAGVCSTCRTRLVKGKVEMHTNYALEQHELDEGFILACQAHPITHELELSYDSR